MLHKSKNQQGQEESGAQTEQRQLSGIWWNSKLHKKELFIETNKTN